MTSMARLALRVRDLARTGRALCRELEETQARLDTGHNSARERRDLIRRRARLRRELEWSTRAGLDLLRVALSVWSERDGGTL